MTLSELHPPGGDDIISHYNTETTHITHGTGTGKTRNEEMEMGNGNKWWKWETGEEKWAFSFITALHAFFAFSNTFWSRRLPQEIAERK